MNIQTKRRLVDIAVSTRVRLARNLKSKPFPNRADEEALKSVCKDVSEAIFESNSYIAEEFKFIDMNAIGDSEKERLMAAHLISPNLALRSHGAAVMVNKNEQISILVNEEDHIRIQCILPGLALEDAFETANKIDDLIESSVEYAFDDEWGYLTACPTNLGTGARMSVMLHLPALTLTNNIDKMLHTVTRCGLTIRGIYGEGTESMGDLYQISNQKSLGVKEEEILLSVKSVARGIIKREREVREDLVEKNDIAIQDKIMRAYGTLLYAQKIEAKEAMHLLSVAKLGVDMDLLPEANIETIDKVIGNIYPSLLRYAKGIPDEANIVDIRRAEYIRRMLRKNDCGMQEVK
ncbi:MAG: protein arginine kinase [Eubacteriaceae bacterium]|nr:protein arginine kinase [Eubacteriaceae bacterium]